MAREIELKFALAPGNVPAFRKARALAEAKPARRTMLAIYFDTPRSDLAAREMALRLRRSGGRWTQTLKAGRSGDGGLHERSEWESSRPGPALDLSLFSETPLARLEGAERLHETLGEMFRVDVVRETWIVPREGARLEVALDRGSVAAEGRSEAICEVEIEVLEGGSEAAFALAADLMGEVALRPSAVTKAQRGHRLRSGRRRAPVKAAELRLAARLAPNEAARIVVGAGLRQLQANEEGLLLDADPEFVHQARVALRRLRAALRIFRESIGVERAQAWRAALGDLGRALGAARDWDVFATEVLRPAMRAYGDAGLERRLRARVARRRRIEREGARAAIAAPGYARTVLDLARWLASPEPPVLAAEDLCDFASRMLRRRHKRLVADAARFPALTVEERHALRIDVKRLRYGIDALASLFPRRRVERYVDILVALQDALGQANDASTAMRLLPELDPPEAFALYARGWFAARAAGDRAVFDALLQSLAATPRFWRKKRPPPETGAA